MSINQETNRKSIQVIKSSFKTAFDYLIGKNRWKYGLLLLLFYTYSVGTEILKLTDEDNKATIKVFVDNYGKKEGTELGKTEIIRQYQIRQDFFYISAAAFMLFLALYFSHDGNKYYYMGNPEIPLMNGISHKFWQASAIFLGYKFFDEIFTRAANIWQSEFLIITLVIFIGLIIEALWRAVFKHSLYNTIRIFIYRVSLRLKRVME